MKLCTEVIPRTNPFAARVALEETEETNVTRGGKPWIAARPWDGS